VVTVRSSYLPEYLSLGGPGGVLGYPTDEAYPSRGSNGTSQHFQGGDIDWTQSTGAHAVYGAILERYRALGGPSGPLGLPLAQEQGPTGHRSQMFQQGDLHWFAAGPASTLAVWESGGTISYNWVFRQGHSKTLVGWYVNGLRNQSPDLRGGLEGTYSIAAQPDVSYEFQVEGGDAWDDFLGYTHYDYTGWTETIHYSIGRSTGPIDINHPPQPPTISVEPKGSGANASFTVTGSGFIPNHSVTIRVADGYNADRYITRTSDASGHLSATFPMPVNPGWTLYFSATDGRLNPNDATGSLVSNTVRITAP
jgi:LGFP repeat